MHNLKNISADLPRNRLIVFTGLSGSGKSSLAFDTLYAEGQRRYVESLSTYARQFLGQMEKPDVDVLEGLSPAVSIEQRTTSRNPRSTVGTITEIYDYLRLLFARVGRPHCPECGEEIRPQSLESMTNTLAALPEGTKTILLAPLVDGKKGEFKELFARLQKEGYVRVRVDRAIHRLDELPPLVKTKRHTIEAVIDRIAVKLSAKRRLADSVATATALSKGLLLVNFPDTNEETLFSERASCIRCNRSLPDLSPQLFSFNSPKGACTECSGIGVKQYFDPDRMLADPTAGIAAGALAPWSSRSPSDFTTQLLAALSRKYNFSLNTPFNRLSETVKNVIFNGTGSERVEFEYRSLRRFRRHNKPFEGLVSLLARRYLETGSSTVREELEQYMNEQPCPTCQGTRLIPEAQAVKVGQWSISDLTGFSIEKLVGDLATLTFSSQEEAIALRILREIQDRLSFLIDVGLGYISLARRSSTLSGGEAQRIRLASQIGSRLAGVLYILDEPSIGLHQRDNMRLVRTLSHLRDLGNTVIVVEHDEDTILAADHILDIGPGAGIHGGNIVYSGDVAGLKENEESVTGAFLTGRRTISLPDCRRKRNDKRQLRVLGANVNNLKNLDISFPLGLMTCVTGVSGSGKSSLVIETLYKGILDHMHNRQGRSKDYKKISGLVNIDKVIDIDQSPIGRTPRSNPATYTGVLTPIRELFSRLPEARARGYKPGRFSFNIKGGRCENCEGDGVIKIAMHFLADMYITCETCGGLRYNEETLEINYRGKTIADILAMNVEEALLFFENIPVIRNRLQTLYDVGLAYISLGQSSVTLSGGEAQRIKLARELGKRSTGKTLYILDEPTTGLHPADITHLLKVLSRLVDSGNTVVVIEHNLDVIKMADHVIDLGPEGGENGGVVIAEGTPEEIAACAESHTGRFLQHKLK